MTLTQSGFPVIPKYGDPRIVKVIVDGVNLAPGVLVGDVATIARWCAERFAATVAPLVFGECWGYAPRQIRGGTGWSNHASATAWDFNTLDFPQGQRKMSSTQIAACRAIVAASGGVLRWGGDYTGSTAIDQQHFEINDNLAGTARLHNFATKLAAAATKTVQEDDVTPQDIDAIADKVVVKLMSTTVNTIDAAQGTTDVQHRMPYTIRDLLARLIRLTGLTQDWVRQGAHVTVNAPTGDSK